MHNDGAEMQHLDAGVLLEDGTVVDVVYTVPHKLRISHRGRCSTCEIVRASLFK